MEFTVAMVVLGVALAGLFPLASIMSRDLQPLRNTEPSSPARDWNKDDASLSFHRHTWYLTPYDSPWMRKLGAGARLTSASVSSTTPFPLQSAVLVQDDDGTVGLDADSDGLEDFESGWTYDNAAPLAHDGDQHRKEALPTGATSTGSATWKITIVAAGRYSIQATWVGATDQATDAKYTVYQNNSSPRYKVVNQSAEPVGVTSNNRNWAALTPIPISLAKGDVIKVQLSDVRATSEETGKYVVADAVRIVQNKVTVNSVERSSPNVNANGHSADVSAEVSVEVNLPQ